MLQVVLPNGDVVKTASRARKSAAGCVILSFSILSRGVALFFSFSFSLDGGEGRGYIINCNMAIT